MYSELSVFDRPENPLDKVIKTCPNPWLIAPSPQWSESREQASFWWQKSSTTIYSTENITTKINTFIINLITQYRDILLTAVMVVFLLI